MTDDERIRVAQEWLAAARTEPYRWGGNGTGVDADYMSATLLAVLRGERTPAPPRPWRTRLAGWALRPLVPVFWWIAETAADAARWIQWARPGTGRIGIGTTREFPWGGLATAAPDRAKEDET